MSLYDVKPWFVRRLRRIEDALVRRRTSPDALTAAAVVVSIAAGTAIAAGGVLDAPMIWVAVPPLILVRLALNALDGSVARRTRMARPFGTALNEIGDRVSDAATVGATAFVARPGLALGALASCYLTSLTGVVALAITGRRDSGGPVGKADRAAILALGAAAGALAGAAFPITVVLWVIVAGSLATATARVVRLRAVLASRIAQVDPSERFVEIPLAPEIEDEELHAVGR